MDFNIDDCLDSGSHCVQHVAGKRNQWAAEHATNDAGADVNDDAPWYAAFFHWSGSERSRARRCKVVL